MKQGGPLPELFFKTWFQACMFNLMTHVQLFRLAIERMQCIMLSSERIKHELDCQRKQVEQRAKDMDNLEMHIYSEREKVIYIVSFFNLNIPSSWA